MIQRGAKARSMRKPRLSDSERKAKAARANGRSRMPRVVKTRGTRGPAPANDTSPVDIELPIGALNEDAAHEATQEEAALAGPFEGALEAKGLAAESALLEGDVADAGADTASDATSEDGAVEASAQEDTESEEEEASEEECAEAPTATTAKRKRSDDEPASFLAMYFRDMAELDVLRPEQEFETARKIEEMETELWKTVLGFAPGAGWIADTVEAAVEKPVLEAKSYRAAADGSRRKSSIQARSRFDKAAAKLAARLRTIDIDRLFLDAALTEIHRVGRATKGLPFEGAVPFSTSTKAFGDYVKTVALKAFQLKTAKNEFVKANLRLVVSIARRFNHGRLPLADLIQEGNIGLMKAVERYDYRRGFRFSTYASWWIRHAISRALADKGRAVRLPVHMIDAYHRIAKSQRELQSKLERPPTTQEVAAATGIEAEKLEKMKTFLSETPVSLDRPISDDDGRKLIDVLVDPNDGLAVPEQMASNETQDEMMKLLAGLKPIEADILRKRFGLVNDKERTLKEIGDEYRLSRERVRQLQEQALGKMRRAMAKREML
jgi:RNA polymerase primary sigma factor